VSGLVLANYRRLVIKVGSSLLVGEDGQPNRRWLDKLADDVAMLTGRGQELLIVSSGAIAIGSSVLGINKRRARLEDLQAAAAAGQVQLVHAYQDALRRHDITAAQVLLTPDDTEDRRRFLNARRTLGILIERAVVPIINENDTVATAEIRYGDNDRLAARIAQLVMADALVLLSDVDGLYSADPRTHADAKHLAEVAAINSEIVAMAGETRSDVGTGGMATKVQAASIATHAGCSTIIASGVIDNPLQALNDGARCTVFRATATPAAARKQWLAGVLEVRGEMKLDDGAVRALGDGGSLLSVGVTSITGNFSRGDVVTLTDASGKSIGRGLAEYSADEASRLLGVRSDRIEAVLGYRGRDSMVHRDELVLFEHE
jgi:glutamate 5-kinase